MMVSEAFSNVNSIYLESAPLTYFVEDYERYVAIMKHIFQLIKSQEIDTFTSVLTLTETLTKPFKLNDLNLAQIYRNVLENTRQIQLVRVDQQTAEIAARVRAQYGLRTPDAIHIATAIRFQCDAFLTNDHALTRVQEISVLLLDDLEIDPPQPAEEETPSS